MRSVGWFLLDMSSAIAACIYIVSIEGGRYDWEYTLDSRLGRTSPQGNLTGSAKGEGIVLYVSIFKTIHLEKARDRTGVSYAEG